MILAKSNCMMTERSDGCRLVCRACAAGILLDPTSVLMYKYGMYR